VSLALWQQILSAGGLVAPVAAGDVHSTQAAQRSKTATHVYVRQHAAADVLAALGSRRVFASPGQRLDFWLTRENGEVALVGERVTGAGWTPRVNPADAMVAEVALADGGRCLYAEIHNAQGLVVAVSAPIWISTST
jgi:hypothetical protein